MQSHYEINVAAKRRVGGREIYVHLFATAPRSCLSVEQARAVLRELTARFPAPEFEVSCTSWVCSGQQIAYDVNAVGELRLTGAGE